MKKLSYNNTFNPLNALDRYETIVPKFKKGDWIMSRDMDMANSWQVAKITKMVSMRKGEFTDYKVEILYDNLGVYNEPIDNWLIKAVDMYSEKMTDMQIKLFKVLYGR